MEVNTRLSVCKSLVSHSQKQRKKLAVCKTLAKHCASKEPQLQCISPETHCFYEARLKLDCTSGILGRDTRNLHATSSRRQTRQTQ